MLENMTGNTSMSGCDNSLRDADAGLEAQRCHAAPAAPGSTAWLRAPGRVTITHRLVSMPIMGGLWQHYVPALYQTPSA